jgi:nitrite reductase/ring-hydroxylating ferredoxin subunit
MLQFQTERKWRGTIYAIVNKCRQMGSLLDKKEKNENVECSLRENG